MNRTQEELERKTNEWKSKLDEELESIEGSEELENVRAYRRDTDHFLDNGDYVRAWESIIYAWGILEALQRRNIVGGATSSSPGL